MAALTSAPKLSKSALQKREKDKLEVVKLAEKKKQSWSTLWVEINLKVP